MLTLLIACMELSFVMAAKSCLPFVLLINALFPMLLPMLVGMSVKMPMLFICNLFLD